MGVISFLDSKLIRAPRGRTVSREEANRSWTDTQTLATKLGCHVAKAARLVALERARQVSHIPDLGLFYCNVAREQDSLGATENLGVQVGTIRQDVEFAARIPHINVATVGQSAAARRLRGSRG